MSEDVLIMLKERFYNLFSYGLSVRYYTLGITLIELLVCLSIISSALLVGFFFAPPLYKKNQVYLVVNDIRTAVHIAKLQALSRGETMVLASSKRTENWSQGMLLFVDDAHHRDLSKSKLLHQWDWSFEGVEVAWSGFKSKSHLSFTNNGRDSTANGYFLIKGPDSCFVKIIVNRVGRLRQVDSC
jgi:type IV fimbrial biogenesis protein FimT